MKIIRDNKGQQAGLKKASICGLGKNWANDLIFGENKFGKETYFCWELQEFCPT
jgi:hypothetical protein